MRLKILSKVRMSKLFGTKNNSTIQKAWGLAKPYLDDTVLSVYAVYYEYAGDYTDDYSLAICIEAKEDEVADLVVDESAEYTVHTVASHSIADIRKTWNEIWEKEEKGLIHRRYTVDFEKHTQGEGVEIHLATL